MIRYLVDASATASHTFAVELRIDRPAAEQRLSLPVWIPGSYLVREFARHLLGLGGRAGGRGPCRWSSSTRPPGSLAAAARGELVLRYRVYAFDTSVRAAFLDADRGFFNGTSLCLRVEGREGGAAPRWRSPACAPGWQVATTLAPQHGRRGARVRRRRLRRAGRPSGRARPLLARQLQRGRRAARVRRRRRLARLRRRAPARRHEAHLRDRGRVLARPGRQGAVRALPVPAQRRRRRPRRARAPRQHGAGRAAPRPAAARRSRPQRSRRGRQPRRGPSPPRATPTCSA